ncbi:MAG: hypothetical protein ABJH68_08670 [Ilumatobacter sp.]|uniref:hypothetical protein n=1 Tax=Ilumatobacter sp. TaxID=1967498 RepID=UPI00329A3F5D
MAVAACTSTDVGVTASRSEAITTTTTTTTSVPVAVPDPPDPAEPAPTEPVASEPDVGRQSTIPKDDSRVPDDVATDVPDMGGEQPPLTQAEIDVLLADLAAQGFCDPDDVRDDGIVTAMHFVVQGQLQSPCYVDQLGEGDDVDPVVIDDDPRLVAAWESLVAITPIELVSDISLVAGYEPCSTCDTLAFVTTLDDESTFFLLAVDVVSGTDDPEELRLTMMHELSHVFNQKPGEQLDIGVSSAAGCDTFFNGAGCFTRGSYMWAWIQEFWPPEIRDTLPSDGSVGTPEEASERCDLDAGYVGSYAAVHPEEDFAETFSAYVYDVVVDPALADKYAFFDRYPEFVSIRESARELGLAGTEANFEGCG